MSVKISPSQKNEFSKKCGFPLDYKYTPMYNNRYTMGVKVQEVADKAGVKIRIVQRWAQKNNVKYEIVDMKVEYQFTEEECQRFLDRDTKRGRRWPKEK